MMKQMLFALLICCPLTVAYGTSADPCLTTYNLEKTGYEKWLIETDRLNYAWIEEEKKKIGRDLQAAVTAAEDDYTKATTTAISEGQAFDPNLSTIEGEKRDKKIGDAIAIAKGIDARKDVEYQHRNAAARRKYAELTEAMVAKLQACRAAQK